MDLSETIKPKSDQLNADDLIAGPITVTVTGVRQGSHEQPVIIEIDGGRQPYKPCKSMRRVLIMAWGTDGTAWVGRAMTLYRDDSVRFGGEQVGGIRISHVSHIDKPISVALTVTRGKRARYTVDVLRQAPQRRSIPHVRELVAAYAEHHQIKPADAMDQLSTIADERWGKALDQLTPEDAAVLMPGGDA